MTYRSITPAGGDTGALLNLQKRLALVQAHVDLRQRRTFLIAGEGP